MAWTGLIVNHALLLLLTVATLASPFLFKDRASSFSSSSSSSSSSSRYPYGFSDPYRRNADSSSSQQDLLALQGTLSQDDPDPAPPLPPPSSSLKSRQLTLMMAPRNERVGRRSELIGLGDTCHVDPVKMSIRPPRRYAGLCSPTTAISYGCRGGCHSYSRVDSRNATNVLRSCSCCRPTGFGFRLVKMKCRSFALRTTVKFALGCHCRPCMASVDSVDIQRLRDLLRGTSLPTIG